MMTNKMSNAEKIVNDLLKTGCHIYYRDDEMYNRLSNLDDLDEEELIHHIEIIGVCQLLYSTTEDCYIFVRS